MQHFVCFLLSRISVTKVDLNPLWRLLSRAGLARWDAMTRLLKPFKNPQPWMDDLLAILFWYHTEVRHSLDVINLLLGSRTREMWHHKLEDQLRNQGSGSCGGEILRCRLCSYIVYPLPPTVTHFHLILLENQSNPIGIRVTMGVFRGGLSWQKSPESI